MFLSSFSIKSSNVRNKSPYWYSWTAFGECAMSRLMRGNMVSIGFHRKAENVAQKWKVTELKSYLQSRGITVSQKRKEEFELVELVEKVRHLSPGPDTMTGRNRRM